MSDFLTYEKLVNGREGWVTLSDGLIVKEAAEIKKCEAKIEKLKTEFNVLGFRGTQTKATGYKGTGSATLYYNTTYWAKMMLDFVKNGKDTFFSIIVKNEDPSSIVGVQRIKLNNCNIDGLTIASVDADTEFLTQDVNFTFSDFEILDAFDDVLKSSIF
jgi:hypothetical protein